MGTFTAAVAVMQSLYIIFTTQSNARWIATCVAVNNPLPIYSYISYEANMNLKKMNIWSFEILVIWAKCDNDRVLAIITPTTLFFSWTNLPLSLEFSEMRKQWNDRRSAPEIPRYAQRLQVVAILSSYTQPKMQENHQG